MSQARQKPSRPWTKAPDVVGGSLEGRGRHKRPPPPACHLIDGKGYCPYLIGQRIAITHSELNMKREDFSPIKNLPFDTQRETYTNARFKEYPNKTLVQICTKNIFGTGTGGIKAERPYAVSPPGEAKNPERSMEESCRRARAKVMDLACCNHFDYMATLTINGKILDRYDADAVYDKLRTFLSNAVQRHGFQYILVPEYHQQKAWEQRPAIHLHGLCTLGTLEVQRAFSPYTGKPLYTQRGNREVFNLPAWTWGFSALVKLDKDYEKAAGYICKYITKGNIKVFGKRYLSSRCLRRGPNIIPLEPVEYYRFRDEGKIEAGIQFEYEIFEDLRIITEELERTGE